MTKDLIKIKEIVESVFGTEITNGRNVEIMMAKSAYSYLSTHFTDCSLSEISKLINLDHSTIIHHRDKTYPSMLHTYEVFERNIDLCHEKIKEMGGFKFRITHLSNELEVAKMMEEKWVKKRVSLSKKLEKFTT